MADSVNERQNMLTETSEKEKMKSGSNMKMFLAVSVISLTIVIFFVSWFYLHSSEGYAPVTFSNEVETDCGKVIGIKENYYGKQGYVFKGIPYAKPPLGNLRWRPPESLKKSDNSCWKGTFKATKFGTECVQKMFGSLSGNEDCLFLNVWTPTTDKKANLPVFVWLHGGYLMFLNGNFPGYAPDTEFVTSMNVVGVSMNYRLNAFGFLTLKELWEEGKSYGNYGIMDQILVLKWIQNNIKNFGGDPDSVTLVGQSSGGTSIFGLLAAPLADNLFHKAISLSGSAKFTIDYKQASEDNRVFINNTKCKSLHELELKKCLYSLSSTDVFNAIPFNIYPYWAMEDLPEFPHKGLLDGALIVVDPIVVKVSPQNISHLSLSTKKSILSGTTAQEVEYGQMLFFKNFSSVRSYLSKQLTAFSPSFPSIVLDNLYNTSEFWKEEPEYLYLTITTDVRVTCSNNIVFKSFSGNAMLKSYRYVVQYRPSSPIQLPFLPYKCKYASHMWDSVALFNFTMVKPAGFKPTEVDVKFMNLYREVVKEFMTTGSLQKFDWSTNRSAVFSLSASLNVLPSDYRLKECQFWNDKRNGFLPYQFIN